MEKDATKKLYRFGVFEADEHSEELRKQGRRLALQGQPLQILLMLLNRPGELVARTEIHKQLWPQGTFVDFDHSLNTAINKIRDCLGDSASSPRFIETLARRGYRFVAPVEVIAGSPAVTQSPDMQSSSPQPSAGQSDSLPLPIPEKVIPAKRPAAASKWRGVARTVLSNADALPQAPRAIVRWLFFLLQLMYLSFYLLSLGRLGAVEAVTRGMVQHELWVLIPLIVTAAIGIPTRLYLVSAVAFDAPGMRENFLKIFPVIFTLDELWALAPFLLVDQVGYGLALGMTAVLLYAPFAQRSLILMGAGAPLRKNYD